MVETFTSQTSDNLANDTRVHDELSLNAEERLFYALLQQPLDNLIKEPSEHSMQIIMAFAGQHKY